MGGLLLDGSPGRGIWLVGMEILAQWSDKDKVRMAIAVPRGVGILCIGIFGAPEWRIVDAALKRTALAMTIFSSRAAN
jgi:hypothetical protein